MKIAFLGQKTIGIYGQRTGGIETHVEALATRMARQGHDVYAYARSDYHDKKRSTHNGVKLIFIPTVYKKNLEAILHTFLSSLHALFMPFDIIHYHGVGPATMAWIPRLLKPRCKVIVTFHSQDRFHQKWSWFARTYLHLGEVASAWFPHVCISVSHVIQVYCRKHYKRQVVYIPNGATVQRVKATNELEQWGLKKGEYILNVGRVVQHKGLHYLIDAHQQLNAKERTKKLVIVGSAAQGGEEYFAELERKTAGDPMVVMTGYQSGETVRQLFAHAYLYVQPSESEGLAVVVLEAMSFGTPVLVSDIPENLEAMHHAGFSFKNKDVNDLRQKMKMLLSNPEVVKEAESKSTKTINEFYNWDRITEKIEEVYRSVRH